VIFLILDCARNADIHGKNINQNIHKMVVQNLCQKMRGHKEGVFVYSISLEAKEKYPFI